YGCYCDVCWMCSLFAFASIGERFSYFFFFQAEDGIRDRTVTGVQTCALPIWTLLLEQIDGRVELRLVELIRIGDAETGLRLHQEIGKRRVGKECRSRWWPYR